MTKLPFIAIRAVFINDVFDRWEDVGPCNSIAEAKSRYEPVLLGYAVVLRKA